MGVKMNPKDYVVGDPLVKIVFQLATEQNVDISKLAARAGLERSAISRWRNGNVPSIANFRAVVESLGYRIVLQSVSDGVKTVKSIEV